MRDAVGTPHRSRNQWIPASARPSSSSRLTLAGPWSWTTIALGPAQVRMGSESDAGAGRSGRRPDAGCGRAGGTRRLRVRTQLMHALVSMVCANGTRACGRGMHAYASACTMAIAHALHRYVRSPLHTYPARKLDLGPRHRAELPEIGADCLCCLARAVGAPEENGVVPSRCDPVPWARLPRGAHGCGLVHCLYVRAVMHVLRRQDCMREMPFGETGGGTPGWRAWGGAAGASTRGGGASESRLAS